MMRRFGAVLVGVCLAAAQVAAANAAVTASPERPGEPQGLRNARKVMQHRLARDQKMKEVKKKGQAKRQVMVGGK